MANLYQQFRALPLPEQRKFLQNLEARSFWYYIQTALTDPRDDFQVWGITEARYLDKAFEQVYHLDTVVEAILAQAVATIGDNEAVFNATSAEYPAPVTRLARDIYMPVYAAFVTQGRIVVDYGAAAQRTIQAYGNQPLYNAAMNFLVRKSWHPHFVFLVVNLGEARRLSRR